MNVKEYLQFVLRTSFSFPRILRTSSVETLMHGCQKLVSLAERCNQHLHPATTRGPCPSSLQRSTTLCEVTSSLQSCANDEMTPDALTLNSEPSLSFHHLTRRFLVATAIWTCNFFQGRNQHSSAHTVPLAPVVLIDSYPASSDVIRVLLSCRRGPTQTQRESSALDCANGHACLRHL